jgi:hypothetical protein
MAFILFGAGVMRISFMGNLILFWLFGGMRYEWLELMGDFPINHAQMTIKEDNKSLINIMRGCRGDLSAASLR